MAVMRYQVIYIAVVQYYLTRGSVVQWGGSIYVQCVIVKEGNSLVPQDLQDFCFCKVGSLILGFLFFQ